MHCATPAEAEEVLSAVQGLGNATEDAAIVVRTADGRVELRQTKEVAAGEGIVAGGTAGMVAGLLLGGPIGGVAYLLFRRRYGAPVGGSASTTSP